MAETRLRAGRDWTTTVRMDSELVKLDPKDPVQAATTGKIIRDINAGVFENMNNLAVVAGTFHVVDQQNQGPVVIGNEEVTVLEDTNGVKHELTNPAMVKNYLGQGMTIVETRRLDIMSSS